MTSMLGHPLPFVLQLGREGRGVRLGEVVHGSVLSLGIRGPRIHQTVLGRHQGVGIEATDFRFGIAPPHRHLNIVDAEDEERKETKERNTGIKRSRHDVCETQVPLGVVAARKELEGEANSQPVGVVVSLSWGHQTGGGQHDGDVDIVQPGVRVRLFYIIEGDGEEKTEDEKVVDGVVH